MARTTFMAVWLWVVGSLLSARDTARVEATGFLLSDGLPQTPSINLRTSPRDKILTRRTTLTAPCEYVQVKTGDTCSSIAKDRCGNIPVTELTEFNGGNGNFCDSLQPRQPVCCTAGQVPDLRPRPNADGSCKVEKVESSNLCSDIADRHYLKVSDLDKFNAGKTWAWAGCDKVQPGQLVCVSKGSPPLPSPVEGAVCGPQKPGTKPPTDGTRISDLNPCPLNVCCNVWGHCGTTAEFCVDTSVDDTPGTAAPGTDGCISNCGLEIVNNDEPPAAWARIAYFEAWNSERRCLHMDVTDVGAPHTHIHFAFGYITPDTFTPSARGVEDQFAKLKKMNGIKRIISFGGWAFSNDPGTSFIMRDGVKPENRQVFADNIVRFVNEHGLDGVDFDWEYPGADDIEGADRGTPEDGPNYLAFLKLVRERLPASKTLAIAAPASYWYLRHFPIKEMSGVVDYIVYMTYDLHGQWDVGNIFVSPGCPGGNCLRSHVNITETTNALAMVTKAGVKANKIVVGISSYGRSFKMTDAACSGVTCTFEGERNRSPANAGKCTDEGGYIADAEILDIMRDKEVSYQDVYDEASDSNILIYNETEWVGWMNATVKQRRVDSYKKLNFAGASDWAVDLQMDTGGAKGEVVYVGDGVYKDPQVQCNDPCTLVLPPSTLPSKVTLSIPPYTTSLLVGDSVTTVTITPEAIVTDKIEFYNVPVSSVKSVLTVIQPLPSVALEAVEVPLTITTGGKTATITRTVTLPPWPQVTQGPPESWTSVKASSVMPFPPPQSRDPAPSPNATLPVVTWTAWTEFPGGATAVPGKRGGTDDDDEDDEDDNEVFGAIVPCDLWFLDSCSEDLGINGWKWTLPPGTLPPGPPPNGIINVGGGWRVVGPLPPWPPITIGEDFAPASIPEKPSSCETRSASICSTSTSFGVDDTGTRTTTTKTVETCHTVFGCQVEEHDEATTATRQSCFPNIIARATDAPIIQRQADEADDQNSQESWKDDNDIFTNWKCDRNDVIIYPTKCSGLKLLSQRLEGLRQVTEVVTIKSTTKADFTAFYHVQGLPTLLQERIRQMDECAEVYDPVAYAKTRIQSLKQPVPPLHRETRDKKNGNGLIHKRDYVKTASSDYSNSHISVHPGVEDWSTDPNFTGVDGDGDKEHYYHYRSEESEELIYVIEPCIDFNHPDFQDAKIVYLDPKDPQKYGPKPEGDCSHGSSVSAQIVGRKFGLMPGAALVPVEVWDPPSTEYFAERYLEGLLRIYDDVVKNERGGRAVVNMSWGIHRVIVSPQFGRVMQTILTLLSKRGVALVTSAGNEASFPAEWLYPAAFAKTRFLADSLIVVGASDEQGRRAYFSQSFSEDPDDDLLVYAPGDDVPVPDFSNGVYVSKSGTSFSAPKVSALIAYLRSLGERTHLEMLDSKDVKAGIQLLQRPLDQNTHPDSVRLVWNGQVLGENCLLNPDISYTVPGTSKVIRPCEGLYGECPGPSFRGAGAIGKRQSCTLRRGGKIGDIAVPEPITWRSGNPKPTCSKDCGSLCDGEFYCRPLPTGQPPDFRDPDDRPSSTADPGPSTTPEDSPTPEPVPALSDVVCKDEADLPGHGDVQKRDQHFLAKSFCQLQIRQLWGSNRPLRAGDDPIERTEEDNYGIKYHFSVAWIDGCGTMVDYQFPITPLLHLGPSCTELMIRTFEECNNGGVGGYIDAVCLRYTFTGGE